MGNRRHGMWCQLYEDVHDHPKTLLLAAELVALRVPEKWATDVAIGQIHRLACWAARDGNTGVVGHLTDTRFAVIVRWMYGNAAKLRKAWRDSGFLDEPGTSNERIHDFGDYFWHLLRKRTVGPEDGAENEVATEGADDPNPAPPRRPTGAAPAPDRRRPGAAPAGARDRAGARAFRLSDCPTVRHPSSADAPAPADSASPPAGGADETAGTTTVRGDDAEPPRDGDQTNGDAPGAEPATSGTRRRRDGPAAPTVDLLQRWKETAATAGYPGVRVDGRAAKVLASVWTSAGADERATELVGRAVEAYFADRSEFVLRQGHSIGEFDRTAQRWLAEAAGTAPSATNLPPRISRLRANAAAALQKAAADDQGGGVGLLPGATS